MEVILSLDEFKIKNEGTQDKLTEDERKKIIEKIMNDRKTEREKERRIRRGVFRGRKRNNFRRGRVFRGRAFSVRFIGFLKEIILLEQEIKVVL